MKNKEIYGPWKPVWVCESCKNPQPANNDHCFKCGDRVSALWLSRQVCLVYEQKEETLFGSDTISRMVPIRMEYKPTSKHGRSPFSVDCELPSWVTD